MNTALILDGGVDATVETDQVINEKYMKKYATEETAEMLEEDVETIQKIYGARW